MRHIPVLRAGRPYRSVALDSIKDLATGEPLAEVSQANAGLIGRDLLRAAEHRRRLRELTVEELLDICRIAAEKFVDGELPVDPEDDRLQSPGDYVRSLSRTTGMPEALCRMNMEKIRFVLAEMRRVLAGLTRGVDLAVLDQGWIEQDGRPVSYLCQAEMMGAVLPSNSPGVHSLWIPSVALKVPLYLRPGSNEPWTPMRIAQALMAAGCPAEAFGFYPSDHSGANQILLRCDRSMFFGDDQSLAAWKRDTRVQLHGTGFSKVVLGDDVVDDWESHLDIIVSSVADNGGRSCVNASGVWVSRHADAIARRLAERLAAVEALPLDDPAARLSAFANPQIAHRMSEFIDRQLKIPGATDVTAEFRSGGRVAEVAGCSYLLPTVIRCTDPGHPLARCELLFPFVSVVEVPQSELLCRIGSTLVLSAITGDAGFRRELMGSRDVDRLNLGPLKTSQVDWDQPHEGNLFEHLYKQRAFRSETAAPAA